MLVIKTAPTIEPITLAQAKEHLRLDSDALADNIITYQSIKPGGQILTTDYDLEGTGISVVGKRALVQFDVGECLSTGTVDVKIQESDNNVTFTDWSGGAFTQVTPDNDNQLYEKEYTGTRAYIRVVAKCLRTTYSDWEETVLWEGNLFTDKDGTPVCEFGVSVLVYDADTSEDDLLTALIQAAREHIEDITRRALLTQTWYYYLDEFPEDDFIRLPFGNLQSVTSIKYKDSDGTETTMTVDTDYLVETNGEDYGRIVLPYGESWPSFTPYPSNPITIEFVCGWTAAASVPAKIVAALKLILTDLFTNREGRILSSYDYKENKAVMALLSSARLWREF